MYTSAILQGCMARPGGYSDESAGREGRSSGRPVSLSAVRSVAGGLARAGGAGYLSSSEPELSQ
jgi:hypothetical protein